MEKPPNGHVLEVRVGQLNQLFNAMDPAPFRERDLDPKAEEFIVGWAHELRTEGPLALVVRLDPHHGTPEDAVMLNDAVREFFEERALVTRRRLRQLFRLGRTSLLIGGWVAMWRPLEVFLYDWWPIRAEARLFDRLSAMTVRIVHADDTHCGHG